MLMRMVTVGGILRSTIKSLFFFLYMAMIYGASKNRMSLRAVHRPSKAQDQMNRELNIHWKRHQHDPLSQNYQSAQSDAMELYSIGAGKLVMVQKSGQVWDDDYELRAIKSNRKGGKRNKFVTETVTYGKLKIRSEENKMYICAKSSGQIVFKNKAERSLGNKKKRTRRRCLFKWSFTEEKHIQLYITSGGRDWYLAVQDNVVNLQPKERSSAKERSFIWLPTRSAHRPKKRRNYSPSSVAFSHARGFPLIKTGVPGVEEQRHCDALTRQVNEQNHTIHILSNENSELEEENKKLKEEIQRLKELQTNSTNSTVSGVVHPTRRKRLLTSLSSGPR